MLLQTDYGSVQFKNKCFSHLQHYDRSKPLKKSCRNHPSICPSQSSLTMFPLWCWGGPKLHVVLPFLPQQPDPSERSRAVASHGVGSRPYWIRMGTAVLVYAPSFNSVGTMGVGQARGPGRPGYTEARQTEHWRGWGSIRNQRRLMWKSQVQCLEKRLLVGNSRQEALWNLQRLYAAEQTAAVWSCAHITLN